ncbi:BTB/POZ domain-containing protein [Aspergillus lucknowensis]|uniref:BTB domain-containing protein n=1 Tax=Aspergillus lucknowensis TaxID=176173 RepID=A0ABR4L981_9EURO
MSSGQPMTVNIKAEAMEADAKVTLLGAFKTGQICKINCTVLMRLYSIRYFQTSTFSDLTITTKDQKTEAHKLIKEVTENVITLEDDDPRALDAMIHFFYGFNYDSSGSDQGRTSPMLFNVKVYQIGDKYGIPNLKAPAKEKFSVAIKTYWDMDDVPAAIASAYSTTTPADRGHRDLLASISLEHINDLLKNDDFKQALGETLGFAANLVQRQDPPVSAITYHCPNCAMNWGIQSSGKVQYCPLCSYSIDWRRNVKK